MGDVPVLLPEEAVGIGARWRYVEDVPGMQLDGRATVVTTLVEREGTRLHLAIEVEYRAMPQVYRGLDLPRGISAHLVFLQDKGSASFNLDTATSMPFAPATSRYEGETQIDFRVGGHSKIFTVRTERTETSTPL